jgi:hypothetical protein
LILPIIPDNYQNSVGISSGQCGKNSRHSPQGKTKNLQTPTFGARTSRFSILAEIAVKN